MTHCASVACVFLPLTFSASPSQVMPRVGEANSLSQEMDKSISFQTKIEQSIGSSSQGVGSTVMVQVTNKLTGLEYLWDKQKFVNRVFLMREMYEKFSEGSLDPSTLPDEEDPFWDPVDFMSMGYRYRQNTPATVDFSAADCAPCLRNTCQT